MAPYFPFPQGLFSLSQRRLGLAMSGVLKGLIIEYRLRYLFFSNQILKLIKMWSRKVINIIKDTPVCLVSDVQNYYCIRSNPIGRIKKTHHLSLQKQLLRDS